jgi:hypothetical protein
MSSTETDLKIQAEDDLLEAEVHLGKALALIHRALPRLAERGWEAVVQNSLKGAVSHLEAARQSHEKEAARRQSGSDGNSSGASSRNNVPTYNQVISPVVLAVAAAAAHALFDQPHRIVSIHETAETGESALQWSAEGRRLIFSSHRIR